MDSRETRYAPALDAARDHAVGWLRSLDDRPVRPQTDADAVATSFAGDLPEDGCDPAAVVDLLAEGAEPGLMVLRALGRRGVADLVDRLAARARELAAGIGAVEGARVLNEVVFTQVCVAFEDDDRTREVIARLLEGGQAWMSGSRWRDRHVLRVSVSNWSTDADDVRRSVDAVRAAASS